LLFPLYLRKRHYIIQPTKVVVVHTMAVCAVAQADMIYAVMVGQVDAGAKNEDAYHNASYYVDNYYWVFRQSYCCA
jgi:uncharacterized membrane protein